jgi:hypothetical protein
MAPTIHRLVDLGTHGTVIVRAPASLLVTAAPGERWFADDESPESKLAHPAVTRWLESLVVAPMIEVDTLEAEDRAEILLAALDAHAIAAEWDLTPTEDPAAQRHSS